MQFQFNGVFYHLTYTQITIAVVLLVVLVMIVVALYMQHRKTRTLALRNRFGSEYDREVKMHPSARQAEAKLAGRTNRVETLKLRDLAATERERFVTEWHTVQSRFVDHPKAAVTEADDLINSLLEARGYPQAGFEQRASDVSVTYPRVMEDYRVAHAIAMRLGDKEATTEELRTAMIQYRSIFDELVQSKLSPRAVAAD
ncbi:MAG TPA: hypothetical protein VFC37_06820 [Terracidiphilus sp.]|jgi:hypothetical protein|nr:hypothetical protein [Terracidiphilus sp.]